MERSCTPQKQPKTESIRNTAAQSYLRNTPQSSHLIGTSSELTMFKDNQSLKIYIRQLEAKNRSLASQAEQLQYEKNYNESRYLQKINMDDQAINQFSKEKNYQIQLLQMKHDQQISRLKRDSELRNDQFLREIKHKDYQVREKDQQNRYLELRNEELRRDYQSLSVEYAKSREQNSASAQTMTHNDFTIKKLEMLIEESELQRGEMESEIRTLLDIEEEKSMALGSLEVQLRNSEENQRRLMDKLNVLSENFTELENHISVMKQKLICAQENNRDVSQKLERSEFENLEKEKFILQQKDRQNQLKNQLEERERRQVRRQREVAELMAENERLYRQLNVNRHRLHQFGIAYGVEI